MGSRITQATAEMDGCGLGKARRELDSTIKRNESRNGSHQDEEVGRRHSEPVPCDGHVTLASGVVTEDVLKRLRLLEEMQQYRSLTQTVVGLTRGRGRTGEVGGGPGVCLCVSFIVYVSVHAH